MRIRWHGHSCFEISDGTETVVVDPHDGKSIGIKTPAATANIVLMTHTHYDHNASRVIRGNHTDFMMKTGDFECDGIKFHGYETSHDDKNGVLRGRNVVYKFTMGGITFCHCGDLGAMPSDDVVKELRGVDILFLPVGGFYTMEYSVLKEFIIAVNPLVLVPMHYRTGGLTLPIHPIDGFVDMIHDEFVDYIGNEIDISREELPDRKECWIFDL